MEAIHYINKLNKAPEVIILISVKIFIENKFVQKMQSDDSSAGSRDMEESSSYPTGRFVCLFVFCSW